MEHLADQGDSGGSLKPEGTMAPQWAPGGNSLAFSSQSATSVGFPFGQMCVVMSDVNPEEME